MLAPQGIGKRRKTSVGLNMTPMIDVVFLLIIFFMLVSNYASAEKVPMDLPKPHKSQAKNVKLQDRVFLNCQYHMTHENIITGRYRIGPNPPESLNKIAERLRAAKDAAENQDRDLIVVIRADRRLPFETVREAMRVVADLGIEQMRLVAHVGEEAP